MDSTLEFDSPDENEEAVQPELFTGDSRYSAAVCLLFPIVLFCVGATSSRWSSGNTSETTTITSWATRRSAHSNTPL